MFWRESFLRFYWSTEAASRAVIGGNRRERGGHWLDESSERNIRHSNRPRDIIVVVQELQDFVVPGRPEYTAVCHWSPGAGRGAAGQASRRLTMPPTLTSRPSWAVRVRRFFPRAAERRRAGYAWPDKGRGDAWEEEVRAGGPSAPTPRPNLGGYDVLSGCWVRRPRRHSAGEGRAADPGVGDAFMLWSAGTPQART